MSKKAFLIMVGFFVVAPLTVSAAQFMVPTGKSGSVVIGQGEYTDLYTVGGNVSVNSPIGGDLFAGGGAVSISGPVAQDLFAAGGNINMLQEVAGDARVAGGTVTFNAPIREDLLVAGGNVTLTDSADVTGDLWAAGGNLVLQGDVGGAVRIAGEEVLINGAVTGQMDIMAMRLTFGPNARATAAIRYTGPGEAVIQPGAQVGQIQFTQKEIKTTTAVAVPALLTVGFFIALLAKLIASLVLYRLFGRTARDIVNTAYVRPLQSFGLGLVTVIVTPIAILLLFTTVIGYYLALLLMVWFGLTLMVTTLFSMLFVGGVLFKWFRRTDGIQLSWAIVLVGVLVYSVLKLIPFVGWIVLAVVYLMVLGGKLQVARKIITDVHMDRS